MRTGVGILVVALSACAAEGTPESKDGSKTSGGAGSASSPGRSDGTQTAPGAAGATSTPAAGLVISVPQVYPPVRAATPSALIGDPAYAAPIEKAAAPTRVGTARQALGEINLASAIRERFYSQGPTDLLRIVKEVDDRVQGLDLNTEAHPCLGSTPHSLSYALPGGQSFHIVLQCLQQFPAPGGGAANWLAFGFADGAAQEPERPTPAPSDAGPVDAGGAEAEPPEAGPPEILADAGTFEEAPPAQAADAGASRTFYLLEGQPGGNGGVYRIDPNGDVEGWIAVAERDIPANSQVLMHLRTREAAGSLELTLGGAAVGFCSAHLKMNAALLFASGKTNAPPPPGTLPMVGTQYCDAVRSGCFRADALDSDLGGDSATCAALAPSTFELLVGLDASPDPEANVVIGDIYRYFSDVPSGVAAF